MQEIWKDIEGYEGRYQVSNIGRIRNTRNGRIRKLATNPHGYSTVTFKDDGKAITKVVHRLVAQAFLPNPNNLSEINHKDEDKTNNSVDNLEWCTHDYNMHYGTALQRSSESKRIAVWCIELNLMWSCARYASEDTDISIASIQNACNPKCRKKTAGGYHWQYI